MSEEKIVLDRICKRFGEKNILNNISLKVSGGEIVTVLGPSGCGKSTIMNVLTGILIAEEGTVTINGKIGYMQQKDLLLPWKTCMENVTLPLILEGVRKDEAAKTSQPYFKVFQLEGFEHAMPSEMSGGMRQRAGFMRTFLSSGDILLLDEPFGAVDSITRGKLQEWLIDMAGKLKLTILLITHDIEEAILLSDRIYVLSDKPAYVKSEIPVRFSSENKKDRLYDPEFLKIKKRIMNELM